MFVSLGLPGNGYQEKIQGQEIYWWGGGGQGARVGKESFQTKIQDWHLQKERKGEGGFIRKSLRQQRKLEKVLACPPGTSMPRSIIEESRIGQKSPVPVTSPPMLGHQQEASHSLNVLHPKSVADGDYQLSTLLVTDPSPKSVSSLCSLSYSTTFICQNSNVFITSNWVRFSYKYIRDHANEYLWKSNVGWCRLLQHL